MKIPAYLFIIIFVFTQACAQENGEKIPVQEETPRQKVTKNIIIDTNGQTIETRFSVPPNFKRIAVQPHSFANYLRQLPLKPHLADVTLYNGNIKPNYNVYDAVVDLKIGHRDLHQCADAVIRLRAEYLWNEKAYDAIHFNFTNGFRADYTEWMKGKRIVVNGQHVSWVHRHSPSNTYDDFWKYLQMVFAYAGTLSLDKELKPVAINTLSIGDVFIQGGSPGHAIIVVDVAIDTTTNEKAFLLAQSYMPAQEVQILKNRGNNAISPWYSIHFGEILKTPEWQFKREDLKRFSGILK